MYGTGKAYIDISEITAGTADSWTITYETGEYGIDDSGEILITRRDVCDSDIPQFDNPNKPGYVKVYAEVDAKLQVQYKPDRYIRPWKACISIKVTEGSLKPGDKVYIQYGEKEGKGIGYRIQTFPEKEHIFNILVDCAGSGNFYPLEQQPVIKITGGYISRLEAAAPSILEPGEKFDIKLRALDGWGNITEKYSGKVIVKFDGFSKEGHIVEGIGQIKGCSLKKEGIYCITVLDEKKNIEGKSNPIKCTGSIQDRLYWGDMHGQTKQTVGTGSLEDYFSFARDKAFMDFTSWQGNDFQVTDKLWEEVNLATKKYNNPGKFITFPGYEWSGTTPVGGDYNIYFLKENQSIHRSCHWQIGMEKRDGTERTPISKLWEEFRGRDDVMAIPHVGGRYGNFDYYDENFVHLVEIHSHHGTFQWFFEDALRRGMKVGIIAASDDHSCRPGLSFPTRKSSRGLVSFDVKGGYTGVYTHNLTRKDIWEALKKRHCYGTTGERIILNVKCGNSMMGDEFTLDKPPVIDVQVYCTDMIQDIQLKRGLETIYSYASSIPKDLTKIRVEWSGVRIKSRSKKTNWDGTIIVKNGRIKGWERLAFDQADEGPVKISDQIITFMSSTSGDIDALEIELDYHEHTRLVFASGPVSFEVGIEEIEKGMVEKKAGGINQKVRVGFANGQKTDRVDMKYEDKDIQPGCNPYWVKVVQRDGHMAWSSPLYVNYKA